MVVGLAVIWRVRVARSAVREAANWGIWLVGCVLWWWLLFWSVLEGSV